MSTLVLLSAALLTRLVCFRLPLTLHIQEVARLTGTPISEPAADDDELLAELDEVRRADTGV